MNIYRTDYRAEVWLRVQGRSLDCDVKECKADSLGVRPDWLDFEVSENGWGCILSQDEWFRSDMPNGVEWALRNGLCPGQKFKIRLHLRWYRCGGYEYPEEWDRDCYWDIIAREPISDEESARRWAAFLSEA